MILINVHIFELTCHVSSFRCRQWNCSSSWTQGVSGRHPWTSCSQSSCYQRPEDFEHLQELAANVPVVGDGTNDGDSAVVCGGDAVVAGGVESVGFVDAAAAADECVLVSLQLPESNEHVRAATELRATELERKGLRMEVSPTRCYC